MICRSTVIIAAEHFLLPRLSIRHTSETEAGQIYIPVVNWALMVAVIILVLTFQTSSNLAAAYGIAVTGAVTIDTLLMGVLFVGVWKWKWRQGRPTTRERMLKRT